MLIFGGSRRFLADHGKFFAEILENQKSFRRGTVPPLTPLLFGKLRAGCWSGPAIQDGNSAKGAERLFLGAELAAGPAFPPVRAGSVAAPRRGDRRHVTRHIPTLRPR